ncbi:MAG TPA: alkaline phosphatase family protein [Bacteroidia bacterium]|nr:alkaline phosphatase family protein [Bacteroidia bacterium]
MDAGASRAFAVADHQISHIYIKDKKDIKKVKELIENIKGIHQVMGEEELSINFLFHERSGQLMAVADNNSWFTYYYWLDDNKAPDFACTVDIHRKPGYAR